LRFVAASLSLGLSGHSKPLTRCHTPAKIDLRGVKQTAQGIVEIGQRLIEVKERLGHGGFLPWLEGKFGWNERTARKWMNVTKTFKSAPGADLSMFQSKALYLLSAPSTPEQARTEALALAESGEKVTHAKAQELVSLGHWRKMQVDCRG
jgi:hypothetical protein